MLERLTVKNFALIDEAQISFAEGLNVMSGETGSGKSVIIEALNFVLGAKPERSLIRNGAEECSVTAEFDVSGNNGIKNILEEFEFDAEDVFIISRRFSVTGKTSIKINGNSATVGMLKKITAKLVDVHGQSEHFELLSVANQLKLLDKFGGEEIAEIKERLKTLYTEYKSVLSELENLGGDEHHRLIRLDVLNFQINEIEQCDLKEGEEEKLLADRELLINKERISSALAGFCGAFSDDGGISDSLGNAVRAISSVSKFGEEYEKLSERVNSVYAELEDLNGVAEGLLEGLEDDGLNSEEIEARLDIIKKIKKKYGSDYDEISLFLKNAKDERDKLENFNETAQKLVARSEELSKKIYAEYKNLSAARRNCAEFFEKNVLAELKDLKMDKANFKVSFEELPCEKECKIDSANGADNVEFEFSANLGEPLKPLGAVISGGEMSRFMLSIKAQTAKYNDVSTFIFDEIDAGISGAVAKVVAKKLCRISKSVQVIAISHLPQIASFADNSLLIYKTEEGGNTFTRVKSLSEEGKINEIVRLVGGSLGDEAAVALSKTLLNEAEEYKASLNV